MTDIVVRLAGFLKDALTVRGVVSVLLVVGSVWLACGVRLRGRLLVGWLIVPLLVAVASVLIAGQGLLSASDAFEGPHLLRVGDGDAITFADLVGVAIAGCAGLLGLALIWRRVTDRQTGVLSGAASRSEARASQTSADRHE